MTYGEVISILEEDIRQLWDDRNWVLAQKTDNPVKTYNDIIDSVKTQENADKIEELPPEQQEWLRKT